MVERSKRFGLVALVIRVGFDSWGIHLSHTYFRGDSEFQIFGQRTTLAPRHTRLFESATIIVGLIEMWAFPCHVQLHSPIDGTRAISIEV